MQKKFFLGWKAAEEKKNMKKMMKKNKQTSQRQITHHSQ
jgi:hypothetical protein